MSGVSASGLFELWVGMTVEGDAVTPTRVQWMRTGIYNTSEDLSKACDEGKIDYFEWSHMKAPAAYVRRHEELRRRKHSRHMAELIDSAPF